MNPAQAEIPLNRPVEIMRFTLIYDGRLPAQSSHDTRVEAKQTIRRCFHEQLREVWDTKPVLHKNFVAQYLALRHAAARPDILDPHPEEMLRRTADAGLIARADSDQLRATRTLLSDVQSLLRLTLDGDEAAFDEAKAPEGQCRLIAWTEGATDLAVLRQRIQAEAAEVRAIYRRIVEEPARVAGWKPRSG